ncbi:MAG TPA: hypothetical protein VIG99_10170 [Myxococcaceae bacterium]
MLDLEQASAEYLAGSASLDDILEAVRGSPRLTEYVAEQLDYAYLDRSIRLIRRSAPPEELQALSDHLAHVAHSTRRSLFEGLPQQYFERWRTLKELLDHRLESLATGIPEGLLNRPHVFPIIQKLWRGPIPQSALAAELDLKKANLSRILGVMEASELIDKTPRGLENIISLGPRAPPAPPPPEREPAARPARKMPRFGAVFANF